MPIREAAARTARLSVRPADAVRDRDVILAVLRRNLPDAGSRARYDWLYLSNPRGPSRIWLLEDRTIPEAIGTSAAHPKMIRIDGEVRTALNLSDFAVDMPYRSLGPALLLLRATLRAVDSGEYDLAYDHPNVRMAAIYARLGGQIISSRRRWVRLLAATPALRRRLGSTRTASVAGFLGDWAIRAKDAVPRAGRAVQVTIVERAPWPDLGSPPINSPVHLVRDAASLRWRFMEATTHQHGLLYAGAATDVEGYLVFRHEPPHTIAVMDMVAVEECVIEALIRGLIDVGRRHQASSLSATVLAGSPSEAILARHGFRVQEAEPGVCVYAPGMADRVRTLLEDPQCWWTFEGDQDV